jgi:hypothetical protein
MAKQRRTKGSILEIKLDNGTFAYAQDVGVDILFFNFFSNTPLDKNEIRILSDKLPLFFLGVYNDAITSGKWKKVGKLPIKQGHQIVPLKFIQDSLNPNNFEHYDPNTGKITKASKEECEGLECAAVWEAEHVEDRLRDYRNRKPNKWVEQLAIK